MKFGINLPNFGPQMDESGIEKWTLVSEENGFDVVLLSDHVALTDDAQNRSPAPFFECLSTLAWLAGRTSTIRLGAGVLIGTHRHPVDLAHTTATIDRLSGGRLVVGIGVGWAAKAFDVLGVSYHRRGRGTDDVLDLLVNAWTHDTIVVAGEHSVHRVHTTPRPQQAPHPPLWIGGNGPAALTRTNRIGNGWHPLHPTRDRCLAAIPTLGDGKDFVPRIYFLPTREKIDDHERPLGLGTLDQIADDVEFLTELGASTIVLDTDPGDPRQRRSLDDDLALLQLAGRTIVQDFA